MTAMAISMFAFTSTATNDISIRTMTLIIASTIAAVISGYLGYTISNGTRNQKLAAGVITGAVAFVGTYQFIGGLVSSSAAALGRSTVFTSWADLIPYYR